MAKYSLNTPLTDADIEKLRAGDVVLLSGIIYSGRDAAHKKLADLLDAGQPLPFDLKGASIYYVGPSPAPPGRPIGSAGPTTSYRMLDNRADYGSITLIYGGRTPEHLCYKEELAEWSARGDMRVELTVDNADKNWRHRTGVVPAVLTDLNMSAQNAVAITCGPPIMIRFTIQALAQLGFTDEQIVTTLERRMKCGVGLCGRCNIGDKFVCVDGPVFTQAQLKGLPQEF